MKFEEIERHRKILALARSNWKEFKMATKLFSAKELDYKIILLLSNSYDSDLYDGAKLLLLKKFPNKLDYQILSTFLWSKNPEVLNETKKLIDNLEKSELKKKRHRQ